MQFSQIKDWYSIYVPVNIQAGNNSVTLPYQQFLKDKEIMAIYQTGNTQSRNSPTLPLITTNFWLDIKKGNDTYVSLPASFLNFNNPNLIELGITCVDFQSSQIVFPSALVATSIVELVVFYKSPDKFAR